MHVLLPMHVLQHLVRVGVACAVAVVVCAGTIAYVTAGAMLYMLLHSVSVAVVCVAAFVVLAVPRAVAIPSTHAVNLT